MQTTGDSILLIFQKQVEFSKPRRAAKAWRGLKTSQKQNTHTKKKSNSKKDGTNTILPQGIKGIPARLQMTLNDSGSLIKQKERKSREFIC